MTYNTPMRTELLSFFERNRDRAMTLPEICDELLVNGHGKSTVYRLVSKLVDAGRIRRLTDPHTSGVAYQFIGGGSCSEHLHLKCLGCGKLIHLDSEISHALGKTLKATRGFILDEGSLLYGKCTDCGGGV